MGVEFNTKPVVATKNLILHNDAIGIDQKVFAGRPVPPDLVAAYNAAVGAGDEVKAPASSSVSDADAGLAAQPPAENAPASGASIDDEGITRPQLDQIAENVGVDEPGKLPNKGAVVEAIKAKPADEVAVAVKQVIEASGS